MSTVSVVIPTWNNAALTIRCLRALERHTRADLHIVWIDNGSDDTQHDAVRAVVDAFDHARERHPEPLGFARAINRGLGHLRGDYTVFLNNDVEVCREWDLQLREAVDAAPGAAGPFALGRRAGHQGVESHPWLGVPADPEDPDPVVTAVQRRWGGRVIDLPLRPDRSFAPFRGMLAFFCVLMPTAVVREIGALDEQFGWGYCEDDDYCLRLRKRGYALSLCPASLVRHDAGHTLGMLDDDWKARFDRNVRLFEAKWGHLPT